MECGEIVCAVLVVCLRRSGRGREWLRGLNGGFGVFCLRCGLSGWHHTTSAMKLGALEK
jgi:hypothetical protein